MTDSKVWQLHSEVAAGESRIRCTSYDCGRELMVTISRDDESLCLYVDHYLKAVQARELAKWILENTEGDE